MDFNILGSDDMEKETIQIRRIRDGKWIEKSDEVALEHHLDISLKDGTVVQVTCTPTYIEEMILGRRFLLGDVTTEELKLPEEPDIESVQLQDVFRIAGEMFECPGSLFQTTGCAHSCVLIRDGKVIFSVEDIGRHNALDKVIGYALRNQIPPTSCAVFSSGRISEDYLQKAIAAGFRIVLSRAAVTASAVKLAKKQDITMLGFIRKGSGNIYHEGKVTLNF